MGLTRQSETEEGDRHDVERVIVPVFLELLFCKLQDLSVGAADAGQVGEFSLGRATLTTEVAKPRAGRAADQRELVGL